MAQHEFAMMDTEHLLWLLTWDSMMAEGDGLSVDDVELICRIITARKKHCSSLCKMIICYKKSGKHIISMCASRKFLCDWKSYFRDSSTATATETVMPTMGLLPAPRKPIISTWAGTEEEPAN